VDVRAAFVAQREAAEAMQPGQGAFDNPAEDAEAAAMRTAGLGHHRHDALRGQSRVAGARPVGAIALHGAGLTARAPGVGRPRRAARRLITFTPNCAASLGSRGA
jgi:hypothetical protein